LFNLPYPDEWGGTGQGWEFETLKDYEGEMMIYFPDEPPIGYWEDVANPLAPLHPVKWERFVPAIYPATYTTGWFIHLEYELLMWTKKPNVGASAVVPIMSLLAVNWLTKRKNKYGLARI